jgi:hypothetical protein
MAQKGVPTTALLGVEAHHIKEARGSAGKKEAS